MKTKKSKNKIKWIPKKQFFALLKAGKLPPELQIKYSNKGKRTKPKKKSTKKVRRIRKIYNKKGSKTLKTYIIYLRGIEQPERIKTYSPNQAEKIAWKKYSSKNILVAEESF